MCEWDWAPVLRRVSMQHSDWLVWKHLDKALTNPRSDVDSAAPTQAWKSIQKLVLDGLVAQGYQLSTAAVCRHVPDAELLLLVCSHGSVAELDLARALSFRGTRWATERKMRSLAATGEIGIRCLRPGAEAFVLSTLKNLDKRGRWQASWEDAAIRSLVEADPAGVVAAVSLMPPALRPLARTLADDLIHSRRARHGRALVELATVSSLVRPDRPVARHISKRKLRRCPVAQVALSERFVSDIETFSRAAAAAHELWTDT